MQDIGSWYNISIVFRSRPLLDERIYFHINRQLPVNTVLDALNDLKIAQFTMKEGKIIVETPQDKETITINGSSINKPVFSPWRLTYQRSFHLQVRTIQFIPPCAKELTALSHLPVPRVKSGISTGTLPCRTETLAQFRNAGPIRRRHTHPDPTANRSSNNE